MVHFPPLHLFIFSYFFLPVNINLDSAQRLALRAIIKFFFSIAASSLNTRRGCGSCKSKVHSASDAGLVCFRHFVGRSGEYTGSLDVRLPARAQTYLPPGLRSIGAGDKRPFQTVTVATACYRATNPSFRFNDKPMVWNGAGERREETFGLT